MLKMPRRKTEPSPIDTQIDKVLESMETFPSESEEYADCLERVERLHKLKSAFARERVSRDTIVSGLFSLAGILVIVAYEQNHVMRSKGLGFVQKTK